MRWTGIVALVLFGASFYWAASESMVGALWPSVVALGCVFLTRRVLLSLVAGGAAGAIILSGGNPLTAFVELIETHFLKNLQSTWKIGAIAFTFMLGGFAALLEKGGALQALVMRFLQKHPRRRLQWTAYGLGLVCFFDGLANSMLVGRMFRGLADRYGVARVKLAYLVDSTSAAVACVSFVSTWIAYQLAMIQEGYNLAGRTEEAEPYALFLSSIPLNFYCWFTLVLLACVIAFNWNIGPMRTFQAETRVKEDSGKENTEAVGSWRAVVPLVILILGMLFGLYLSGAEEPWPFTLRKAADAFGRADAALVLVCASAVASLGAFAAYPHLKKEREKASEAYTQGVLNLFTPIMVLIGAWILSSTLGELEAGSVIARLLTNRLPVELLPMSVFLVSALVAFSTGTSWGTMGIIMPLAIPVAFEMMTPGLAETGVILPGVVAAVFSGAVFGDHCSPISDTTIVSSVACGVDAADHVRTQLPYAMIAAGLAAFAGFLPTGYGFPVLLSLVIGVVAILLITRLSFREKEET